MRSARARRRAIGKLGIENGFLGNDAVRIPLPDAIKRVESGLRLMGMQPRPTNW